MQGYRGVIHIDVDRRGLRSGSELAVTVVDAGSGGVTDDLGAEQTLYNQPGLFYKSL